MGNEVAGIAFSALPVKYSCWPGCKAQMWLVLGSYTGPLTGST
jgi:hypothetical protein